MADLTPIPMGISWDPWDPSLPHSHAHLYCRRGTARICCRAPSCGTAAAMRRAAVDWYFARRALSRKPAAAACGGRIMGQTDRQTDGETDAWPLHIVDHVSYTVQAVPIISFADIKGLHYLCICSRRCKDISWMSCLTRWRNQNGSNMSTRRVH